MTAELDRLAQRLKVAPAALAMFDDVDPADIASLDAMLTEAMEDEANAFAAALTEALQSVPRLLRGPAQRLLFPGGKRG